MTDNIIATVIYPACGPFLPEFLYSINNQTLDNFELILFNDGIKDAKSLVEGICNRPFKIIDVSGTPAKIRESVFSYFVDSSCENIMFADSDDQLSENQLAVAFSYLDKYPIVFFDLDLIDRHGHLMKKNIWTNRMEEGEIISKQFLEDKNVIGLGNTSLKKEVLKKTTIPEDIVAVDWFYFTKVLENHDAIFTNKSTIKYRQYNNNSAGIGKVSPERLKKTIRVKKQHYNSLPGANEQLEYLNFIEKKFSDEVIESRFIDYLDSLHLNYFWWEETNYFNTFLNE